MLWPPYYLQAVTHPSDMLLNLPRMGAKAPSRKPHSSRPFSARVEACPPETLCRTPKPGGRKGREVADD